MKERYILKAIASVERKKETIENKIEMWTLLYINEIY